MKTSRYSESKRKKALAMLSGGKTASEVAAAIGCSATTIRNWDKTDGPNSWFIPTKEKITRKKRTLKLVPLTFACPHCGGEVERP